MFAWHAGQKRPCAIAVNDRPFCSYQLVSMKNRGASRSPSGVSDSPWIKSRIVSVISARILVANYHTRVVPTSPDVIVERIECRTGEQKRAAAKARTYAIVTHLNTTPE